MNLQQRLVTPSRPISFSTAPTPISLSTVSLSSVPATSSSIREFKIRVQLQLRGRRKTKGIIKEDNSLHVDMHQTDRLEIIDLGCSGVREHRYTNYPNISLFYNQGLQFSRFEFLHTRNKKEEWVAHKRKKKNRKLVFSRCFVSRIRTSCLKPQSLQIQRLHLLVFQPSPRNLNLQLQLI